MRSEMDAFVVDELDDFQVVSIKREITTNSKDASTQAQIDIADLTQGSQQESELKIITETTETPDDDPYIPTEVERAVLNKLEPSPTHHHHVSSLLHHTISLHALTPLSGNDNQSLCDEVST